MLWLAVCHNDLCWCFSVAASGVWEFPPQGLNSRLKMFVSVCLLQPVVCGSFLPQGLIPRPKSWESCHPSNELQQKAKVGHSLGLLTLPTDALSAASFEIDGTLANEKGRVGKPCFSSSKEASGASSADSIVHSSFPLGIQRLFQS